MSETYTLTRDQLETVLRSTYAAGEQAGESPLSAAAEERRFRRDIDAEVARAAEYTARKPTNETTPDAVEQAIANLVNVLVSECSHTSETASALDVCIGNLRHAHRAERDRHAEEVANRVAEMRGWGESKLTGAQHEIEHLRDQLRKAEGERDVSRRQCGELHEHLALIVRYFEEETSEGDGIADQHWAGYQLAKIVLVRTAPNEAAWETAMVEFAQLQERASRVLGLSAALDDARHELDARRALDADVRACAEYCRNILIGPPGMPVEDYPLAPVALAARRILAALDSHECPECHMPGHHKLSCSRGGSKGARVSVSPREGGE